MDTQTQQDSTPATETDSRTAEAVAAYHAGDPDGVPTIQITAASRDLSCKQSGPETYRRVRYPGATEWEWPDADRLPRPGIRSSERHAEAQAEVPIGTLVVSYHRDVYRGRRGRCSVIFFLARQADEEGKGRLLKLPHRTLRARPVYEITLPDGTLTECPRRD